MRKWLEFQHNNPQQFVNKLLNYSQNWSCFQLLHSNINKTSANRYHKFELIAACDILHTLEKPTFEALKQFNQKHHDWIFGHFSYDLKNQVENLQSDNKDKIQFPELFFFVPRYLFIFDKLTVRIGYLEQYDSQESINSLYQAINNQNQASGDKSDLADKIKHNFTKAEYLLQVEKIKKHILKGDVYEMNFCTEFYSEETAINPYQSYCLLNRVAPAPFSAFYKLNDKFLLSSSPERFLAKRNDKIISQPIKGTIRRGKTEEEDLFLQQALQNDVKERAENIMITDLVRNDLSRTAVQGSVKVEELCQIYSYKYVHQMVSTVISELNQQFDSVDVIKNAFPMGSMTGAPKVKAMELIEKYERTRRGLYSGSVGYITPEKNFDFNVIIRSILYNQSNSYLSFSVGSAITHKSIPEKEYEECLLKAEAMKRALSL